MRFKSLSFLVAAGLLVTGNMSQAALAADPDDVIARVGDQIITFHDLDVTINSSAMIGMPIPEPGTRERTTMRLTLLDREITADLLYLDALARKVDDNPVYRDQVQKFADTILAMTYKQLYLVGELPVSDEEIRTYFQNNFPKDTAFTQDIHMAIEAKLRKARFQEKLATLRERLRKSVNVQVFEDTINADGDAQRKSSEVVATAGGEAITWGQVRALMKPAGKADTAADRRESLEKFIDKRIMVQKARQAGLEKNEEYRRRVQEYRKSSLVTMQRARVEEKLNPGEDEVRAYYTQNRSKIALPETRKIQMVVLKDKDQAEEVKRKIESGKITIYQAAQDYSIDPNARMNLGDFGWVAEGTGFPDLDQLAFSLKPNELGGPVKSPAGWHLVKVVDTRPAQFQDIEDHATWNKTRRMLMHEKVNAYVTELRETTFPVKVYDDVFSRLTQKEADALRASEHPVADKGDS